MDIDDHLDKLRAFAVCGRVSRAAGDFAPADEAGLRLSKAFMQIHEPELRRLIADLVEEFVPRSSTM